MEIQLIFFWVVCGVFAYAAMVGQLQRMAPNFAARDAVRDRCFGVAIALFGPCGVLSLLLCTTLFSGRPFKHGFKF